MRRENLVKIINKMSKNYKVLITNPEVPQIAIDLLSEKFEVILNEGKPPSRNEILSKVQGVDALFWAAKEKLDKEVLDIAGPKLRVISTMSVGLDLIDIPEVKSRGILLGNTKGTLNESTAEVAILLLLAAARRMHEGQLQMQTSQWKYDLNWLLGLDVKDSTVGIVGLGNIGLEVMKRLKAFDVAQFLYTGRNPKPDDVSQGAKFVTFDELLKKSDFIIASCPYTKETHHLFNKSAFDKMKSTAVFVNIARGLIVDQDALIEALESNQIFAAGLDVMTPEPLPIGHKLYSLPNCVLIPHLGSATVNTRKKMASVAAKNILAAFENKPMPSPV